MIPCSFTKNEDAKVMKVPAPIGDLLVGSRDDKLSFGSAVAALDLADNLRNSFLVLASGLLLPRPLSFQLWHTARSLVRSDRSHSGYLASPFSLDSRSRIRQFRDRADQWIGLLVLNQ